MFQGRSRRRCSTAARAARRRRRVCTRGRGCGRWRRRRWRWRGRERPAGARPPAGDVRRRRNQRGLPAHSSPRRRHHRHRQRGRFKHHPHAASDWVRAAVATAVAVVGPRNAATARVSVCTLEGHYIRCSQQRATVATSAGVTAVAPAAMSLLPAFGSAWSQVFYTRCNRLHATAAVAIPQPG